MPVVGDIAPTTQAKDQTGTIQDLKSFRGKKVLLAFYPYAFSSVCTTELSCFQEDLSQFQKRNVEVIGISVDSHYAQRAYAEKLGVSYLLLSDFNRTVSRDWGVLRDEGCSERAYFVIDEHGIIRFAQIMDAKGKRLENSELLAALA